MFFVSLFRIIKFSLQDISRNMWLSVVTVVILVLALFSINMLVVVKVVSDTAISAVKEKVDVNLYVKPDAPENEIMNLKSKLQNLSQVKSVEYVSKRKALESFRDQNTNNPEVMQALQLLENNPLTPNLVIKPQNPDNIDTLIGELNKIENPIIESKNFLNHKKILQRIKSITDKVNAAGLVVSLIFVLITLLVIYNAVRVAIYTHHQEITIMRLVGASSWFIYFPFLLSSIIYTLFGVILIIGLFYPFLSLLQPYLEAFFVGYDFNIITYFNANFVQIFGIQFLGIAAVNILASLIAIRKYARA
ncbi:MAG TPA: ABC transporter permease [Patescibacteria group bacterium]|nr:ABC transporter permease [Patescibacteria group bacterium]